MESRITTDPEATLRSRLRTAGVLAMLGLTVEIGSFFWIHPLAFMAFLFLGCGLLGLGVVIFLWTLLTAGREVR